MCKRQDSVIVKSLEVEMKVQERGEGILLFALQNQTICIIYLSGWIMFGFLFFCLFVFAFLEKEACVAFLIDALKG